MVLAAGFEPALPALEEQRLLPLGHASTQISSGIDEIRTRVILIDNQVPMPLGHDPVAATTRLELARAELRTQTLDSLHSSPIQYRLQDLNPDYSLIGQVCCQLHQAGVFQRTGSGRRPRTFTLRFQRPACCLLHHPGIEYPGRTTGLEPALTRATISRLILSATFAIKWQGWRDLNSLNQA